MSLMNAEWVVHNSRMQNTDAINAENVVILLESPLHPLVPIGLTLYTPPLSSHTVMQALDSTQAHAKVCIAAARLLTALDPQHLVLKMPLGHLHFRKFQQLSRCNIFSTSRRRGAALLSQAMPNDHCQTRNGTINRNPIGRVCMIACLALSRPALCVTSHKAQASKV